MLRNGALLAWERLLVISAASLFCFQCLPECGADYVETFPRPGASLPPPIAPGECPLAFLQADIQHAGLSACSSGMSDTVAPSTVPSSCCGRLQAVLFQARVRYANETGRLLLPEASARACIESLDSLTRAAGVSFVTDCKMTSELLSEETGKACGNDLTTVYDFWSATNHTFPGTVGLSCYSDDCGLCTTLITSKIMSLGSGTTALLSTPSCQDLAQIAMTAAAYPLSIANGISRCLHDVEIAPVVQATKCTAFDWTSLNYTSLAMSCGPQQIRADRCCNYVLSTLGQGQCIYRNRTGHELPQEQVPACFSEFEKIIASHGVPSTTVDTCRLQAVSLLHGVGCYNYTTLKQPIPTHYYRELEAACNPAVGCGQCKPAFFKVGAELANTTSVDYLNLCMIMFGTQYFSWFDNPATITARLNCYYQFPPGMELGLSPPRRESGLKLGVILGICAVGALLVVSLLFVLLLVWLRCHGGNKSGLPGLNRLSSLRLRATQKRLQIFSRRQLKRATKNFDKSRLLGRGGSGKVYVGELNGEAVAIKEASFGINSGTKEAWNEVATLARCRHRNLVVLKGCCISGGRCSLVYEFMEQGSLEDHLYEPRDGAECSADSKIVRASFLDWPTRAKIALGTASGLAYLHEECKPRCIHRDVKPSNILLDQNFEAKVADFGLAKLAGLDDTHITTGIAGTWGYLSPEYMATGQLTEKSDVYSFGVVLLTLVAGRRPTRPEGPEDEIYLPEWAWALAERNELGLLLDPRLEGERKEHAESMERMTRIALLCVHTNPNIRPSMRKIVNMLSNHLDVPPLPTRPVTLYTLATMSSFSSESASMLRPGHESLSRGSESFTRNIEMQEGAF